jgi:hypothetical protein
MHRHFDHNHLVYRLAWIIVGHGGNLAAKSDIYECVYYSSHFSQQSARVPSTTCRSVFNQSQTSINFVNFADVACNVFIVDIL